MIDAEYAAEKARIEPLFAKWIPLLYLERWDITVIYHQSRAEGEDSLSNMDCRPNWLYLRGEINVYCPNTVLKDATVIETMVTHELMHCVLDEVCPEIDGHAERVAQELAIAFQNVWRAGASQGVVLATTAAIAVERLADGETSA